MEVVENMIQALLEELGESTNVDEQLDILNKLTQKTLTHEDGLKYAQKGARLALSVKNYERAVYFFTRKAAIAGNLVRPSLMLRSLKKGLQYSEEVKEPSSSKATLYQMTGAYYFSFEAKSRSALKWYEEAFKESKRANHELAMADALWKLGEHQLDNGSLSTAFAYISEACRLYREHSHVPGLVHTLGNLSLCYGNVYGYPEAIAYGKEALEFSQTLKSYPIRLYGLYYYGACLSHAGRYKEAEIQWRRLAEESDEVKSGFLYVAAMMHLAEVDKEEKKYSQAERKLDLAEEKYDSAINRTTRGKYMLVRARIYAKREEWELAIPLLREVVEIFSVPGFMLGKSDACSLLATAYECLGDIPNALTFYKLHIDSERELLCNDVTKQLVKFQYNNLLKSGEEEKDIYQTKTSELASKSNFQIKEMQAYSREIRKKVKDYDRMRSDLRKVAKSMKSDRDERKIALGLLQELSRKREAWSKFATNLMELKEEFVKHLMNNYPTLTERELQVCSLVSMLFTNKEMAYMLNIAEATVVKHRSNIRKKLGLKRSGKLVSVLALHSENS